MKCKIPENFFLSSINQIFYNSNNFVENSQVDNVQISSETTSEQVVEKAESNSETKENSLLPSSQTGVAETEVRSEEVSVETYEKNIENLKPVSYSDVTNMLTEDGGDHILYVGRPTCYYCRQNSPVLKDFNTLIDGQLLYYIQIRISWTVSLVKIYLIS